MENPSIYKCIVVEDEALIRRNISKKVQQSGLGFSVIAEVMDGRNAIKIIESETPQLVITDIHMPIMNGLELIKYMYFAYPEIKAIIISSYNEFDYACEAIHYEVKDYLIKPITTEKLLLALTRIRLKLDSDFMSISNLANNKEQKLPQADLIGLIEFYIKENYKKDISIEDIASNLHLSHDYLSRIYKKCTGQSPLKYLINLRINEAKRILITDYDLNIKRVGQLVGYTDQYYFSRIFKNSTGIYPSEYRTQNVKC